MVAYAVYLVYRSERLKKVLEAGADTIKYPKLLSFSKVSFHTWFSVSEPSVISISSPALASWLWVTQSGGRPWTGSAATWAAPSGERGVRRGTPSLRKRNLVQNCVSGGTRRRENTLWMTRKCLLVCDSNFQFKPVSRCYCFHIQYCLVVAEKRDIECQKELKLLLCCCILFWSCVF